MGVGVFEVYDGFCVGEIAARGFRSDVQSRDDCAVFRGRSEFGRWGSKLKQARGFFITGR